MHIKVRRHSSESPMYMRVRGIDAVSSHVEARPVKVPRFGVADLYEGSWLGVVVHYLGAAVADTAVASSRCCARDAGASRIISAELGSNTALAPDRATCVQRTRNEPTEVSVRRRKLRSRLERTADRVRQSMRHGLAGGTQADSQVHAEIVAASPSPSHLIVELRNILWF